MRTPPNSSRTPSNSRASASFCAHAPSLAHAPRLQEHSLAFKSTGDGCGSFNVLLSELPSWCKLACANAAGEQMVGALRCQTAATMAG